MKTMLKKTQTTVPGSGGVPEKEGHGFYLGLDLGQSVDYSALVVLEKVWVRGKADSRGRAEHEHYIRHAHRYRLGTPYPRIVADVKKNFLDNPDLWHVEETEEYGTLRTRPYLALDATGVGAAVRNEFEKVGIQRPTLVPIIITGGVDQHFEKGSWRIPKSRLLERMQVDAQYGQLKIASGIDLLDTLKRELANVRPKMKAETAYLSYEEIRESEHDDLVLATSLAHWAAHKYDYLPSSLNFA